MRQGALMGEQLGAGHGKMTVRFYGVRGSIATSSPAMSQVGGHTSCVEVTVDEDGAGQTPPTRIILDAGTGLKVLGDALTLAGRSTHLHASLLVSHFHWDHIQGFPFFGPAYLEGNRLDIYAEAQSGQGLEVRAAF